MATITIRDLEVFFKVGVPDEERFRPQRLLVTVRMAKDISASAATDDVTKTIDYDAVTQRLLRFGDGRSWKLIETLALEIARALLVEFAPSSVTVEVKKFVISQARYVSVQVTRFRTENE